MVCHMTQSSSRSQMSESCKKWLISLSVSSDGTLVIKRLMVNYDSAIQYLNFSWSDFDKCPHSTSRHVTFNVTVFHGPPLTNEFCDKRICVLRGVDWQSHKGPIYPS